MERRVKENPPYADESQVKCTFTEAVAIVSRLDDGGIFLVSIDRVIANAVVIVSLDDTQLASGLVSHRGARVITEVSNSYRTSLGESYHRR